MFTVRVPATSANLGPGFDTLGLALDLFLQVQVEPAAAAGIQFSGEGADSISRNPERNLVTQAMQRVCAMIGQHPSYSLSIQNHIPIGKGLGSSAAAIVAGIYAANQLLGCPLDHEHILSLAVEMEGHPDNIVPAMMGGLTTAMVYEKQVYYQKADLPGEMAVIVIVPDFELPTEKSRSVLPQQVDLQATVNNLQRACYLLACLHNGDFRHMSKAMDDQIYQPLRKQFIPGFDQVLEAAAQKGAVGSALSGAGPSIIAFCANQDQTEVAKAMQEAFATAGVVSRVLHLQVNHRGAEILF